MKRKKIIERVNYTQQNSISANVGDALDVLFNTIVRFFETNECMLACEDIGK